MNSCFLVLFASFKGSCVVCLLHRKERKRKKRREKSRIKLKCIRVFYRHQLGVQVGTIDLRLSVGVSEGESLWDLLIGLASIIVH